MTRKKRVETDVARPDPVFDVSGSDPRPHHDLRGRTAWQQAVVWIASGQRSRPNPYIRRGQDAFLMAT